MKGGTAGGKERKERKGRNESVNGGRDGDGKIKIQHPKYLVCGVDEGEKKKKKKLSRCLPLKNF